MSSKPLSSGLIASKVRPAEPAAEPIARKVYQLGEPLNFRVKADFKRLFKSTAAQHGLKMNELLVEAFDIWLREKRGE